MELFKHTSLHCPTRYPFTPGLRECMCDQSALPRSTGSEHFSAAGDRTCDLSLVHCARYHWGMTPHSWNSTPTWAYMGTSYHDEGTVGTCQPCHAPLVLRWSHSLGMVWGSPPPRKCWKNIKACIFFRSWHYVGAFYRLWMSIPLLFTFA